MNDAFDAVVPLTSVTTACRLIGRAKATHYRKTNPKPPPQPAAAAARPAPAIALAPGERDQVAELLCQTEYADLSPRQVYAIELDAGRYWCSISTMYRILRDRKQVRERRAQATHPARVKPELIATEPSQVWSWDITKLKGPAKGVFYHAYVIIDVNSRYVPGYLVATTESSDLAADLIADTIDRNGTIPESVHADRGTSMTSKTVASLLTDLGVARSHSRPRVSNDNPFCESQFKTLKYTHDFPDHFDSIHHARDFMDAFMTHYNHEHRHTGIGLHTPASVHFGTADTIRDLRQHTLTNAYHAHPERFTKHPKPPEIPQTVWINNPETAPTTTKTSH